MPCHAGIVMSSIPSIALNVASIHRRCDPINGEVYFANAEREIHASLLYYITVLA